MSNRLNENQHYLGRVVPQHRKPKFLKWLDTNIQPFFDGEKLLKSFDDYFNLEMSQGVQMQVTGDIVGRNRVLSFDPADGSSPILDDETYRLLQKAKISMNQWDGTIPGIYELWGNLFPQYKLVVQDNQDMTMDLYIGSLVPPIMMELMGRGYIAPKPMGVLIRFTFMYEYEPIEKTVYIGGAAHNAITTSKMPTFIPDFNFRRTMGIAGFSHNITENRLPQVVQSMTFERAAYIGGYGYSVTQSRLPQMVADFDFTASDYIGGHGFNVVQTTVPKYNFKYD